MKKLKDFGYKEEEENFIVYIYTRSVLDNFRHLNIKAEMLAEHHQIHSLDSIASPYKPTVFGY